MKKQLKSIISLFAICTVVAILMALTNSLTAPLIKKNEDLKSNEALLQVLPSGEDFQKLDISKYTLPASITEAYGEKNGGYVFKAVVTGYSTGMTIMCGIAPDGTVSGTVCLASGETLGYEKTYGDTLKGKDASNIESVDLISGATKTTSAYRNAVKDALNAVIIIGGGSVDLRDEAQIFNDNLSAALPAGEGKFTALFIAEEISGIDSIYTADNGSGAVYIAGESFVGVGADGKVIGEVSAELKAAVEAAAAVIGASKQTELDLSAYEGLPSALKAASKTDSGNFVLTLNGSGYGIVGGDKWHPASGKPIVIKISMTAEGKIIRCVTVSEEESDGIGDACADSKFYSQFDGKTQDSYKDIDAISGATVTTDGYLKAVGRAFEALEILNGGNANE